MESALQLTDTAHVTEVASLLLPLTDKLMLLPNVCVAEIVPFRAPDPLDNKPDWVLGQIEWREQNVPLICLELLQDDTMMPLHHRCRVAILNNTGVNDELPFIGIITQGIPRLVRVIPDEISEIPTESLQQYESMQVQVGDDKAVIPDVTAIEQAYLDI